MFYKNGWYEPLTDYDFADYPKNVMSVATFGAKAYIVPLVTEWQVLYYRKDLFAESRRSRFPRTSPNSKPLPRSSIRTALRDSPRAAKAQPR